MIGQTACLVIVLTLLRPAAARPPLFDLAPGTGLVSPFRDIFLDLTCDTCKLVVTTIDELLKLNATQDGVVAIAVDVCKALKLESDRVCELVCPEFKDELFGVLENHYATPTEICGSLIGTSCAVPYDPKSPWYVLLPAVAKPTVVVPNPPQNGSPVLSILHVSDIHWDMMYMEGSNVECGEPLCCRANDGKPPAGKPGAGKWGDYRGCDTPERVFRNMLQDIAKNHKIDFVYLTGDLPAHDVWNQSRSDQLGIINATTNYFQKYLPGIPVYPAIGNHESAPVNSFPPPYVTGPNAITWLYQGMVDHWITNAKWLPKSTTSTMLKWLLHDEVDPAGELAWLINVLQDAETSGELVHILGHIPPSECLKQWSDNYFNIVNRYESTIRGQFFGHTHKDSYQIFYEEKTDRPTSVLYIGGSVTTFSYVNPNYRIYAVDGNYSKSSWAVLDHETYVLNITDANLTDQPVWKLEYTAKAAYGLKALQPSDWDNLVQRFAKNDTLFNTFYANYYKGHVTSTCDAKCKSGFLCGIQSARAQDSSFCN